ncbi:MAG: type II toxin-antitoxin system HicA family toxin [Candidatus Acidiferrales bacterium]
MPNARELVRFLCANGYVEARQAGSHLILKHSDRKTLTVPMHRGKDLPKGLFLRILKEPGLLSRSFAQDRHLASCLRIGKIKRCTLASQNHG